MAGFGGLGAYDIWATIGLTGDAKFNRDLAKAGTTVDKAGQKMNKVMNVALLAGAAAFVAAAGAAVKFETQMANVHTLLDVSDK